MRGEGWGVSRKAVFFKRTTHKNCRMKEVKFLRCPHFEEQKLNRKGVRWRRGLMFLDVSGLGLAH